MPSYVSRSPTTQPPPWMYTTTGGADSPAVGGRYTDRNRSRGPFDGAVLTGDFGMDLATRHVEEPLARRLHASVGCQLKRRRLQYLLHDGVDGRLLLSDGHGDTVRSPANQASVG